MLSVTEKNASVCVSHMFMCVSTVCVMFILYVCVSMHIVYITCLFNTLHRQFQLLVVT